jgi:4-hydroxy-tetrahydrodipicolinate reductase
MRDRDLIPVVVNGRAGRMGTMLASAISSRSDMRLEGRLSQRGEGESLRRRAADSVVVDFTHPLATRGLLIEALEVPCALVIGTSGLLERDLLRRVAERRAVVHAANFSKGLWMISRMLGELARRAGAEWDAQVLDLHYAGKVDRPSATAHFLAERWREGSGAENPPEIATLRLGDGVSEHTVLAAGPGERIEIAHRVLERRAFIAAVMDSVRFVHQRPPGLYGLDDVYRE